MLNKNSFYQESNIVNPSGLVVAYLAVLVLTIILGFIYTQLMISVPFIYFKPFFIFLVAWGLELGIRYIARLTHNRNKESQLVLAAVAGLLLNYFQWIPFVLFVLTREISIADYLSNLAWITSPKAFLTVIGEINAQGAWSLWGVPVKGVGLAFFWIGEAIILIALPVIAVYTARIFPYSETHKQWYPKFSLTRDFETIPHEDKFIPLLRTDALKTIQDLGYGTKTRYILIHVFYLPQESKQYLSFERVYIEGNSGRKNITPQIENFGIDSATAKALLEKFKHKKGRFALI